MKDYILFLFLALFTSVIAFAEETQTVGIGTGKSKEDATQNALRNALENVYGVYLSSSTSMVDDKIISDEITSVSYGKIVKFKVIGTAKESDNQYVVTVDALVSLDKLASFISENTGTSVKFDGAGWGLQQKMDRLNKENEEKAARNIVESIKRLDVDLTPSLTIKNMENASSRLNSAGSTKAKDRCLMLTVKFDKKLNPNQKALLELVDKSFKALENPKTKKFLSTKTKKYYDQLKEYIDSRSKAFAIRDVGNGVTYPIWDNNCLKTNVHLIKDGREQVVSTSTGGTLYYNENLGYNWQFKVKSQSPTMGGGFSADYKTIIVRIFYSENTLEKVKELLIVPLPK